jgi:hypothetical protein
MDEGDGWLVEGGGEYKVSGTNRESSTRAEPASGHPCNGVTPGEHGAKK